MSCFASVYDKTLCFHAIVVFVEVKLVKRWFVFLCLMFLFLFVLFLLLSVGSLNNEVAFFCVCVVCFSFAVNKTKWFSGLHLVVLFLFWLFCVQFLFFAESPMKIGVSTYFEKGKRANNVKRVESNICPRLIQNSFQVGCAPSLDRCLTQKMVSFCLIFLLFFSSHSPCRKNKIFENK